MDNHKAFWTWWDFAQVIGGGLLIAQKNDTIGRTDWELLTQAVRTSGLGFACSLFELQGFKYKNDHANLIFHLRNAAIHNGGDVSKNDRAPVPFNDCRDYIDKKRWLEVDPNDNFSLSRSFSMTHSGQVTFGPAIFELVSRILRSFLSEEEKKRPAP